MNPFRKFRPLFSESVLSKTFLTAKRQYLLFSANHPFSHRVILAAVILGTIFIVFAWVPYKINERFVRLREKQSAELSGQIQILQALAEAIIAKSIPDDLNSLIQRIRNQSKILIDMSAVLNEVRNAYLAGSNQSGDQIQNKFFLSFSDKIKRELDIKPPFDQKTFDNFNASINRERVLNTALMNLAIFRPESYFGKPLAEYEAGELRQKLIALNEAMGQSELNLNQIAGNSPRARAISQTVKSEHSRLLGIIDKTGTGSSPKAQKDIASWSDELARFRNSLSGYNGYLIRVSLTREDYEFMDSLLGWQKDLRAKIKQLKSKYF